MVLEQCLQDAILATFDHAVLTDEKPQHGHCWCFYEKALATGQDPGTHHTHVGTPLSAEVGKHVEEVHCICPFCAYRSPETLPAWRHT